MKKANNKRKPAKQRQSQRAPAGQHDVAVGYRNAIVGTMTEILPMLQLSDDGAQWLAISVPQASFEALKAAHENDGLTFTAAYGTGANKFTLALQTGEHGVHIDFPDTEPALVEARTRFVASPLIPVLLLFGDVQTQPLGILARCSELESPGLPALDILMGSIRKEAERTKSRGHVTFCVAETARAWAERGLGEAR